MVGYNNQQIYPIAVITNDGTKRVLPAQGISIDGLDFPAVAMGLYSASGFLITDRQPSVDALSDTTPRALDTIGYPYTYDPVDDTWDRVRGNHSGTLLASAARTASANSTDQTNFNHRGVHIIINVSAYPAAASVVPTVQGYDPLSGQYYDLLVGNAITATGYTVLKIYPGIGEIANGAASDILPRTWRISMAHADTDSITYSVGYQLVL